MPGCKERAARYLLAVHSGEHDTRCAPMPPELQAPGHNTNQTPRHWSTARALGGFGEY